MSKSIEILQAKHQKASLALSTLSESIESIKKINTGQLAIPSQTSESVKKAYRDSMIQRFEYSFDIIWKYLKNYLVEILGIKIQIKSPKTIFRECLKAELLTEDDIRKTLKMVDDRNQTTHAYNEKLAEKISQQIPNYYKLMKKILDETKI